jgi:transcriptional regulator with XRE-family HTH domain
METTLNQRLKMLRTKLNLSQNEFALKIGASLMTVSRWENGAPIPQKNLYRINQEFGVSNEWLLNGVGVMEIKETETSPAENKVIQVLQSQINHLENEVSFYREILLNLSHKVAANFKPAFGSAGHDITGKYQGKVIEMFAESVRAGA